jgi:hypothetical protein
VLVETNRRATRAAVLICPMAEVIIGQGTYPVMRPKRQHHR